MNPEAKEAAERIGAMVSVNLAVIQILEEVWKHGYQQGVRDCSGSEEKEFSVKATVDCRTLGTSK